MNSAFIEPGALFLIAFVALGAVHFIASAWLRPRRRRLLQLVTEIARDKDITREDKAWLRTEIDLSKSKTVLFASIIAPFAIIGALILGFYEGWRARARGKLADFDEHADLYERDSERMHKEIVELDTGLDPAKGKFWSDPRRKEVQEIAFTIENWSNPLAMIWILFWLVASIPLLAVGYFLSGSMQPFIQNLWEPIRDPVAAILHRVVPGSRPSHSHG
ncbi:hypothetical protein ATER59S_02373 [Aquamicrobium terrae]